MVTVARIDPVRSVRERLMMVIFFLLPVGDDGEGRHVGRGPCRGGTHMRGGPGTRTRSTPSNHLTSIPLAAMMPMAFAQSMGLPPPTATTRSQASSR